jgi:CRISPR-associated protein Cas8a1/Csx13
MEMTGKLPNQENLVVQAMHNAIRNRFGRIAKEHKELGGDLGKRFDDERQRIRLSFSSAKTQNQVRKAFADLWSNAGGLKTLQDSWEEVTSFITDDKKWMLARDLALIGLASYKGRSKVEDGNEDDAD